MNKTGMELIAEERERQVKEEGFDSKHDDQFTDGQLFKAATAYYMTEDEKSPQLPTYWPWDPAWWKPKTRVRNMVRAGALYMAERERLQRAHLNPFQRLHLKKLVQSIAAELDHLLAGEDSLVSN